MRFGDLLMHSRERLERAIHFRMDRRLSGRVDPADVVQDAFVEATERLSEYREQDVAFFVWLRFLTMQRPCHGASTSLGNACSRCRARNFDLLGPYSRSHICRSCGSAPRSTEFTKSGCQQNGNEGENRNGTFGNGTNRSRSLGAAIFRTTKQWGGRCRARDQ